MRSETLPKQRALRVGDREAILVGNDPVPEGADVAHLIFRRQLVKTRRGKRERVCHEGRIARGARVANTGPNARAWRGRAIVSCNFLFGSTPSVSNQPTRQPAPRAKCSMFRAWAAKSRITSGSKGERRPAAAKSSSTLRVPPSRQSSRYLTRAPSRSA